MPAGPAGAGFVAPLGATGGATGGALGINTKIVSAPARRGPSGRATARRYALQDTAGKLLPGWRVASCMRQRIDDLVKVIHHPEHGTASYGGVMTCGSVWTCPVCATRVAARRREEIERGAANWRAKGGGFLLVTFTLRHHKGQRLETLLETMNQGHRWARGGRVWQRLAREFGIRGAITSRETTIGGNGWHPHLHAIWFTDTTLTTAQNMQLTQAMSERWIKALKKYGGDANKHNGFNIQVVNASDDSSFKQAIDYPVKAAKQWSVVDELVKGGTKLARGESRNISQLLGMAHLGDTDAGKLFREYAHATKGDNLVVWTPGLRALCGLEDEEKTDGELAQEQEKGGEVVLLIPGEQWVTICAQGLRGKLLYAFMRGGPGELASWGELHSLDFKLWQWANGPPGGT